MLHWKTKEILKDPGFRRRLDVFCRNSSTAGENATQLMRRMGVILTAPYPDPAEKSRDFGGSTHTPRR